MPILQLQYQYLNQANQLVEACAQLQSASTLYINTEFHRESSYYPKLALIQILGNEQCYLVDPLAIQDLTPLWTLIHQQHVTKVFHAARQDIECIFNHSHKIPYPIFDTQVAASLLGYGAQVGFSSLTQQLLDIGLNKEESFSDWLMRPLSQSQKDYAACDVLYLEPLYQKLMQKLEQKKRLAWLYEEQDNLYHPDHFIADNKKAFQRVKGAQKLKGQRLAILRELALWREEEAQHANVPRRRVLSDEFLLNLSKRKQPTLDQIHSLRGISSYQLQQYGDALLEAVRKGKACPKDEWPKMGQYSVPAKGTVLRQELLATLIKLRAYQENIAVELLANKKELMKLAAWKRNQAQPDLPCLHGWRKKLVGNDMLKLLQGQTCLSIDLDTMLPAIRKNM